ncbi:MAG: succinyldiaminopimelate transaminase [Actinobacteria bacterium]|nr:succinyldiaminopimelate transaminase [Actinomycetota bacterium]
MSRKSSTPSGLIDLSQGTPVDPTPDFIQEALQKASNSPSYPVTAGTLELREAISNWASNNLGASGEFGVLPLIGSKELVAWLPTILESEHVLYPEIAYPTYLVGSMIAKTKATKVDFDANIWPDADLAWVNSPSNPTGRVHTDKELINAIQWARGGNGNRVVVADECYLEFGNGITPKSILSLTGGNNKNILAIHSLSKRSSMAGYRAAMMIGDKELIAKILEVRKHAGMMVPLPVQRAMVAALADKVHVEIQRDIYNARKAKVRSAIEKHGFKVDHSEAGLYLWATRNERDWDSVAWFANQGILVTPGHFYGELGANHVRIAMTATDAQIDELVRRIG